MTFEEIRRSIGSQRFDQACAYFRSVAASWNDTPFDPETDDLQDVPHDLDYFWRDATVPILERVELVLDVYRAMPCYWNAVGIYHLIAYESLSPDAHRALWEGCRSLLDDDDAGQAYPYCYCLLVENFEDSNVASESWQQLIEDATPLRLERVLAVSMFLSWKTKRGVLTALSADPAWAAHVAGALLLGRKGLYHRSDAYDELEGEAVRRSLPTDLAIPAGLMREQLLGFDSTALTEFNLRRETR